MFNDSDEDLKPKKVTLYKYIKIKLVSQNNEPPKLEPVS